MRLVWNLLIGLEEVQVELLVYPLVVGYALVLVVKVESGDDGEVGLKIGDEVSYRYVRSVGKYIYIGVNMIFNYSVG